jgi:WD40 repeat protein
VLGRFTADGTYFVRDTFMGEHIFEVVDPITGKILSFIDGETNFVDLKAMSANGRVFAFSDLSGYEVRFLDLVSKKEMKAAVIGYTISVTSAAFTPDSKKLVAGYDDYRLIRWDVTTGTIDKTVVPLVGGKPESDTYIGSGPLVGPDSARFLPHPNSNAVYDSLSGERVFKDDNATIVTSTFAPDESSLA